MQGSSDHLPQICVAHRAHARPAVGAAGLSEECVCVCVCERERERERERLSLPVCVHAREGRGAPRSSLAAAPNFIPIEGLARCGMRARRRRCQLCKSLSTPGTKKGNLRGRRGGPSTDLSPTGPCWGGAGGGGPEPPGTPPEIWDVAAQGRGGAWTLRPQSLHRLDHELEPSGCPGSGLQKLSLITPCSDCPALPFRSQEPSWTRLRVYARFPIQSGRV